MFSERGRAKSRPRNLKGGGSIRILCLDQSTKITGYSEWKDGRLIDYGTTEVNKKEKNQIERMCQMYFKVKALIIDKKPDFIFIEGVQFQNSHQTHQLLSQLQGTILAILFEQNIGFNLVEATSWKSHCQIKGRKRAEQKANTIQMVKDRFSIDVCEDVADSIGLGIYAIGQVLKMRVKGDNYDGQNFGSKTKE